jgi:hypothetical protein
MTLPVSLVFALIGLVMSARFRLNAVVLGQPVSVPWLAVAAVVIVLLLVAAVLILVRLLLRDGLRLKPVAVNP